MVLLQMVDNGVRPDNVTYNSLIHGYSSSGHWKDMVRLFKEMKNRSVTPDVCTYNFCTCKCRNKLPQKKKGQWKKLTLSKVDAKSYSFEAKTVSLLSLSFQGKGNTENT